MAQAQPKVKKQQQANELQARYQNVVREVHSLPQDLLADLLHEIADTIREQTTIANGSDVETVTNGHHQRNDSTGAAAKQKAVMDDVVGTAEVQPSGFDLVIAQDGPMAEVTRMLKRGNLTDEERQQMKQMAYEAWRAMPPSNMPPPTNEEIKQMRDERRMKKYGR